MSNYRTYQLDHIEYRNMKLRAKRIHELRCHIIIFVLSVLLFGVLFSLIFSNKSEASANKEEKLFKYYTSVEIKSGDTLSSICEEYISSNYSVEKLMNEVIYINNISDSSVLRAGEYLVIPYYNTYKG